MAHKNKENLSPYITRQGGQKPRTQLGQHKKPKENFSFQEADERILDIFRNHGFESYPHKKRQMLTEFYMLLMEEQNKNNFTRLVSLRDTAIKHFIDSLIITQYTDLKFPLLDVGTGPGFPGIPLKIHFPDQKIYLAEGVQKRVEFLKKVRDHFHFEDLMIFGKNVNSEFVYPVHGVITRAVEDISNTLHNVQNCLQNQGFVYFMKGPEVNPEIQKAQAQWKNIYRLHKDIAYKIPETPHERRLVIFQKVNS